MANEKIIENEEEWDEMSGSIITGTGTIQYTTENLLDEQLMEELGRACLEHGALNVLRILEKITVNGITA